MIMSRAPMEEWLEEQLKSKRIAPITAELEVLGIASVNPWYDDGVTLDWHALHRRMKGGGTSQKDVKVYIEQLIAYGAQKIQSFGEDRCLCTVMEVVSPWELQLLDAEASRLSSFTAAAPRLTPGLALTSLASYAFLCGPPGMEPVMRDVHRFLTSVETQLRQQNIRVQRFLGSLVLFEGDMTALLHHTAAVHKALTNAGLKLSIHQSSFSPQPLCWLGNSAPNGISWTSLDLTKITREEDVTTFAVDLFFLWLGDSYLWQCLPPVKVFDSKGAVPQAQEQSGRRLELFMRFFNTLVRPSLSELGIPALRDFLELEEEDFQAQCSEMLKQRRKLVGPQKWTTLDLRLTLCRVGGYDVNPVELFATG